MRALESVTLLCLDTRNPDLAVLAMQKCMARLRFADAVLLTHKEFQVNDPRIKVTVVEKLRGIDDYSRFMVKDIGKHFSTSHVLVVQWDGFVVNPDSWEDGFLSYDYVGAPWSDRRHAVGNGGFSLRSRKLVEALQDPRITELCPEDYAICDHYHDLLVSEHGIRFPPLAVASRFSCEMIEPQQPTFGVHGVGTLHWVMTDHSLAEHLKTVPKLVLLGQIGRNLAKDCIQDGKRLSAERILAIRFRHGNIFQKVDAAKLYVKSFVVGSSDRWHPIYNAFGFSDRFDNLKGEYRTIPKSLSRKWFRKYVQRELILCLTGQIFLQRESIPRNVRRVLWFYDWNTLGDCIMDLSQRHYLAERYQVDICMPSGPADLFEGDPAFHRIYRNISDCPQDYDFILLHDISSTSIRIKLTRYFSKPWASMIKHQQGEQYSRILFSAARLEQLMGEPMTASRPKLPVFSDVPSKPHRIAIALGGIDPRRRYERWPELLQAVVDKLDHTIEPRFVLMGSGEFAHNDLASFSPQFLERYADIELDQPDLSALKLAMSRCSYFIGCDSGLMHLAESLDKPGIALFGHIRPEWRLLPESRLLKLFDPFTVNNLSLDDVAVDFVRVFREGKAA